MPFRSAISMPIGEFSMDSRNLRSLMLSRRAAARRASVPRPTAIGGMVVASSASTGNGASAQNAQDRCAESADSKRGNHQQHTDGDKRESHVMNRQVTA